MNTYRCTTLQPRKGLGYTGGTGVLVLVFLCLAAFAPAAWAQEEPDEEPAGGSGWEFAVVPYLWMPSLNGNIQLLGQQSSLNTSFFSIVDELLHDLQFAGMADIEVSKERFGLFVNTIYLNLFEDKTFPAKSVTATAKLQQLILGFGVMYRVGPISLGGTSKKWPSLTIEPYLGGRYTYIDVQLKAISAKTIVLQDIKQWAYPMLGGRTVWAFTQRWNLTLAADVGGFDIGGSRLAWSATGLAGYRFNFSKKVKGNVQAGYRALYQDYSTGSGINRFEFDVTMHGPVLGLAIEF